MIRKKGLAFFTGFLLLAACACFLLLSGLVPDNAVVIRMTAAGFVPKEVSIAQGQAITFQNADSFPHWPATGVHPTHTEYPGSDARKCQSIEKTLLFDACGPVSSKGEYTFIFDSVGDWDFHDHLNPQFAGVIHVTSVEGYRTPTPRALREYMLRVPGKVTGFLSSVLRHTAGTLYGLFGTLPPAPLYGQYTAADLVSFTDYKNVRVLSVLNDDVELMRMVAQLGVAQTLQKAADETGGNPDSECHLAAHLIGKDAFMLSGVTALKDCNLSCHAGCYHGAMEAMGTLSGSGGIIDQVRTVCGSYDTFYERYMCFHGIGHGLMLFVHDDLPAALQECRSLGSDAARDACYGGVFMENLFGDGSLTNLESTGSKWFPNGDLHYPCDALNEDENTLKWCYELQSEYIFQALNWDVTKTVAECLRSPQSVIGICFKSMGREFAAEDTRNSSAIEKSCTLVPPRYFNECITGASKLAIEYSGPDMEGKAVALCKGFVSRDAKSACYDRYSQSLLDMFNDKSVREHVCSMFEAPYDARCLAKQ